MLARLLFVAVIVAASAEPTWGPDGHEVTASIAQALLSSNAASQVATLLGGQSLASVSTWADQVKSTAPYKWSAVLHFINTPDWACNYDYSRDCGDAICVSGAIKNYTSRLSNPSLSSTQRAEALKFLTHFIGDIHQPLHVAFTSDAGGNSIKGTFLGKSDNLHYIWDTPLPQMRINDAGSGSQSQYSNYLLQQMQSTWNNNISYWSNCGGGQLSCPDDWAEETIGYACSNAYVDQNGNEIKSGFNLGQAYYQFNIPVVDLQLLKGGIRLAATLNRVFGSSTDGEVLPVSDIDADEARAELASNRFDMMQRIAQSRTFFEQDRAAVAAKLADA